jgi:hypothetical protein
MNRTKPTRPKPTRLWTKEERDRRRSCAPLLPPPGDEVLVECLDQLDAVMRERDYLAAELDRLDPTCAKYGQFAFTLPETTAREQCARLSTGVPVSRSCSA